MKKYWRIFEIVDGVPTLVAALQSQSNYYDSFEEADCKAVDLKTLDYYYGKTNLANRRFTILPVYEFETRL